MTFQGDDFLINSTTSGNQTNPTQTVLGNGDILVAWESQEGADYPDEIRARILNPDGSASSPDFIVNATTGDQNGVKVTTLPYGDALVTWSPTDLTTGEADVRARIVHADGSSGPEFIVNSPTTNAEIGGTAATLANGTILATWTTEYPDEGNAADVVGRLLNADGSAASSEFVINSTLPGLQYAPSVAALPDGDAFVTWVSSNEQSNGYYEIFGRILNADGTANAPDFQINSSTGLNNLGPTATALTDGSVLVTWNSGEEIRGRIYDSDGAASGPDFMVSAAGSGEHASADASATALPDGGAVVVWDTYDITTGYDIYARVANADGSMSSMSFVANSAVGLTESDPHVTELSNGELFVTWTSYDDATRDQDIHGRLLTLDNTVTGTAGKDALFGTAAADHLYGGGGNDDLTGRAGDDFLSGGTGHNLLWGNLGNDTFLGGPGTDTFAGGAGNDTVVYNQSAAGVTANLSTHIGSGGDAADDTFYSIENVIGSGHNDTLIGNAAGNRLEGGSGNDVLKGGAGNDILFGGAGKDVLIGGTGADTFVFKQTNDSTPGQADRIIDFSHAQGDHIDLSSIDANTHAAGDQAFTYIGRAAFTDVVGQLHYANHMLEGDTNGDGKADIQIHVNVASLSAGDLIL